jgi:hypothetical protein
MSARANYWDREKRVLWLIYEGRGGELEANLRGYSVDYVPALHTGWIGICYRPGMSDADRNLFMDSAIEIVELLTARRGITQTQQRRFLGELATVQNYQYHLAEAAL